MPLSLFWLLAFVLQHQGFDQKIPKENQGQSETCLVSSQNWTSDFDSVWTLCNSISPQYPSFQRRRTHPSNHEGNYDILRSVEVHVLQKDFQSFSEWLQHVSDTVARVSRHQFCAALPSRTARLGGVEVSPGLRQESTTLQREKREIADTQITKTWWQKPWSWERERLSRGVQDWQRKQRKEQDSRKKAKEQDWAQQQRRWCHRNHHGHQRCTSPMRRCHHQQDHRRFQRMQRH